MAEQYQKQLYRAEEDRRQALATSEALTALWQKKFEKAQTEKYDLRQELLSAQDRISHLHDQLAMVRLQTRAMPTSSRRTSPPEGETPYFKSQQSVPTSVSSLGGYSTSSSSHGSYSSSYR